MTEERTPINGYIVASTKLTEAVNAAFGEGVTIDEVFAALKVQCEVLNLRLSQVVFSQQQAEHAAAMAKANEGTENAH